MTQEEADALQQAYRRQRKAWARSINHPYPKKKDPDDLTPPPAVLDGDTTEEG